MPERGLAAAEKVVEHDDIMSEEHKPVDEVRSDKACSAGDKDALLLRAGESAHGRVGGPGREGDRGGPVEHGVGSVAL